jgi:hypothetical protein
MTLPLEQHEASAVGTAAALGNSEHPALDEVAAEEPGPEADTAEEQQFAQQLGQEIDSLFKDMAVRPCSRGVHETGVAPCAHPTHGPCPRVRPSTHLAARFSINVPRAQDACKAQVAYQDVFFNRLRAQVDGLAPTTSATLQRAVFLADKYHAHALAMLEAKPK